MGKSSRKSPPRENTELAKLIERDLTALAGEGKLTSAHGVDSAVTEVLALLTHGGKSPLLAGDSGVGKSAIVQELARRISQGQVPKELASARVLEVSLAGIFARTSTPRQSAELFEELLEHLAETEGTLVHLRDAGLLQGSSLGPVAIRFLRSGRVRFVLEAEVRRAQELLRSDEALAERLHLLVVHEPPLDRCRWILARVAEELEDALTLQIDPAACDMALRLATKFLLARRLPRSAIELLRETVAEAAGAAKERVGTEDVISRFCASTHLPRFIVDDGMPLDFPQTERFFSERLLGQSDAVATVLRSVALLKAGLSDPRRPLGVFLFAGPTGVGKTHLAKLLAEYLFGSPDRLVRLNMADYPEDGDELQLFGSSWGQTLEAKRGELTRLLDGKVFSVLLLDEFEKAHASCHDRFLQLFDEGRFVNAAGETISCNNTLIVATSNVGSETYREPPIGFSGTRTREELISEVDRRISEAFRPEFLNRFDALCHFYPLSKVEIRRIAQREVGRVLEREGIRARGLDVEVLPEVVDLLVERGYSPLFGARFLQREIEKTLTAALAVEIARGPLLPGTPIQVVVRQGRVTAYAQPLRAAKDPTAQVALPAAGGTGARRRVDRRGLIEEADGWARRASAVGAAAGRGGLEKRRADLLAHSQSPNFWDDAEAAAATLRDFREIESKLLDLDRVIKAALFAGRRAREARSEPQLAAAAKAVEDAAREVQLAEARLAAGSAAEVDEALLEICAPAEGAGVKGWIGELLHMYRAWAQKRGYEVRVVAESAEPCRAVLKLTGPGVLGFLAGERGLHRRIDDDSKASALVRVHARPGATPEHYVLDARDVRRHAGSFVPRVGAEVSARDDETGRTLHILGEEPPTELRRIAAILLLGQGGASPEARRYFVGRGARVEDARTGTATPRVKDVLRGELDQFIAAWLEQGPAAGTPRTTH